MPLLFLLLLTLTACGPLPYSNIDNDQLQLMLAADTPIYDVRRPEEWIETGIVENSRLLTYTAADGRRKADFLEKFTAQIDRETPVILICDTGGRTRSLARYLADDLGYTQVYNVRYGIMGWISEGRAVTLPLENRPKENRSEESRPEDPPEKNMPVDKKTRNRPRTSKILN